MFNPEIYTQRRKKLIQQLESGILLFLGNDESPMNYTDNPYPFRQDSSFLYYWGLNDPGYSAVIDLDSGEEIIFGYDYTIHDIVWMGPQPSLAQKVERAGVRFTRNREELPNTIENALKKGQQVHYLPQYRPENLLKLQDLLKRTLEEINEQVSEKFIKAVVTQRSIKAQEEINEINRALDITYELHNLAMRMMKPGLYEREIAGAIQGKAYELGGKLAFPMIFSIHGETLHNHSHNNLMKTGHIVVNDCGGESVLGYAGDITRTIPVSGKFDQKQKDIYSIVLKTQLRAIDAIEPGIKFLDIHILAAETITAGLIDLDLMRGDPKEAVNAGAHALFFPHGLGHMLGLDVHDMENLGEKYVGYNEQNQRSEQFGLRYLRFAKELKTGHVITVEPGIYFIPELIDLWEGEQKFIQFINYEKVREYRSFGGVRIEDDVLVTDSSREVLGRSIPKTIEEVEALTSV